ncbi:MULTISPECIES: acetyl-CoA C-acyltransferase [Alcaligenes]|uniref:acetyl-CoA C-acyltransferase n=1 Tax=Alcaligenes TaxID=507 RepID=UPI000F691F65|nr:MULTISPECIES: acetyl-CoA C-acyltransferase [Alcaligenes]MBQ0216215.1 acetyl-CoA C-acyltransferase [Alcaligenes faecalis]MBW4790327.1 acetyl-CoA C-acyltransferase [Alcaligenes faecalis subsp. faecalis]RSE59465.1 acetyl-CoA C-acyltransferase [Alcaligenes faecalis]WHQ43900.1 acetyl-CoA C-acyltransferase [Alcaligenes faecalis]
MQEVVLVQGCRTAFGNFGGALRSVPPVEMGAAVMQEVLGRSGVSALAVEQVVMGQVVLTEPQDIYLARAASMKAGVAQEAVAMSVNRLCASGLQAIISAAQAIALGEAGVALAGGVESTSRMPYMATSQRWGSRMGNVALVDVLSEIFISPLTGEHVGVTGENVARKYGVSRCEQDQLALESHRRAVRAIENGYFKEQIVTMVAHDGSVFEQDERVRHDGSLEQLADLKPIFQSDGGTVTAGNILGLADAAAVVLMMEEGQAHRQGLKPMGKLRSWAHAGVDPQFAGMGPVPSTRLALKRAGLTVADIDVIESNEAFAAQVCAVARELDFDPERVNPNGGSISMGHPLGATGAALVVKALHELQRIQGRYALVTMCHGGSEGVAMIIERQ